jgi:putative tricarboxylic transport membrane protein
VQRTDRVLGLVLALLALAVLYTARGFPDVPGQRVGAGFLPMMVGAGLLAGAVGLLRRSFNGAHYAARPDAEPDPLPPARRGAALAVLASMALYVLLADRLGFLLVAPLMLMLSLRAFGHPWRTSLAWAVGGTLLVHLAFYKLLRVPLPWGVLRPFY